MSIIHFLNVYEGDCNIIQHDEDGGSKRVSVIDVSNAYNDVDTDEEKKVKAYKNSIRFFTQVPAGKRDFKQRAEPDNPIEYIKRLKINSIFRFVITHPDMDHLDGIEDLFSEFQIQNTWDTGNIKKLDKNPEGGRFNPNDWNFYTQIRDGKYTNTKRLELTADDEGDFWTKDNIHILCPTKQLVGLANSTSGDYHDLSYVLLYTPPKRNGQKWKIIFAGDSHDNSWKYILENHKEAVTGVDVLFAPHHGRDSNRDYTFLETLKPRLVLFGNASSSHLAYDKYNGPNTIRITNNQAGFVIMSITENAISVYVKNRDFANQFRNNTKRGRNWGDATFNNDMQAYFLCTFPA